jgi:thiol-disulfide isomerase/thioredoxin
MRFHLTLILAALVGVTGCFGTDDCGNGVLDKQEECDTEIPIADTCQELFPQDEHTTGSIACTAECKVDSSSCDPCGSYPCAPYGSKEGETTKNIAFELGNQYSQSQSLNKTTFEFKDVYRQSVANGGNVKGLAIFLTTGWCTYCSYEAMMLEDLYQEYKDQGLLIMGIVVQDANGDWADGGDAEIYSSTWDWTFPSVPTAKQEPSGVMSLDIFKLWPDAYVAQGSLAFPLTVYVNVEDMTVHKKQIGLTQLDQMKIDIEDLLNANSTPAAP